MIACTPEETEAYAERLHYLLHLPAAPERARDLAPVGLCSKRRECHLVHPWTRAQRRVRRAWSQGAGWDDGSADWYREERGLAEKFPPRVKPRDRRAFDPCPNPNMLHMVKDGQLHSVPSVAADRSHQYQRDIEEAQPGTAWLRENQPDTAAVMAKALASAGLDLAAVLAHFAARRQGVVRATTLRVVAEVCPAIVPVAAVAELFGMPRLTLYQALARASV